MRSVIAALAASLIMFGCGSGVSGSYSDSSGIVKYTFKSGKLIITTMGTSVETDYRVEDGNIKITMQGATIVMPINKDGSIQGPGGIKLTKKD